VGGIGGWASVIDDWSGLNGGIPLRGRIKLGLLITLCGPFIPLVHTCCSMPSNLKGTFLEPSRTIGLGA
jgi:hypothetical protein